MVAVLFGIVVVRLRHQSPASAKVFHLLSQASAVIPIQTSTAIPARSSLLGLGEAPLPAQSLSLCLSEVDEGLIQLENDLHRATFIADEGERNGVLIQGCLHWADVDPADALKLMRKLGAEQVSEAVLEDILQKWADRDFSSALLWAYNEVPGEKRDRLIARLAFVRSQTQPEAAAMLVVNQIMPGPVQDEAYISVLYQWAVRDFSGTLAWVNRFPSGDLKKRAITELLSIGQSQLARGEAQIENIRAK